MAANNDQILDAIVVGRWDCIVRNETKSGSSATPWSCLAWGLAASSEGIVAEAGARFRVDAVAPDFDFGRAL